MIFDKSKVYTALNADELKVGSKVILANYLESLKDQVESNSYPTYIQELKCVMGTSSTNRFKAGEKVYNLAYLISEPEKSRPFKNIDELIVTYACNKNGYTRPLIWIENRFTQEVEMIATYDYANSFHSDDRVETSTRVLTMEDLYREYKFLNGDICGVKE